LERRSVVEASRSLVQGTLAWNRLLRAASYLESAPWTVTLVAIVIELVVPPVAHRIDAW
jgi:hypothetical protein